MIPTLLISGWFLGLLPTVIVLQHALFLHSYRTRFSAQNYTLRRGMQFLAPALKNVRTREAEEFGLPMLTLRYGIPAVLIGILAMTWFYLLSDAPVLLAAYAAPMRLGALGAYFYILLLLGQRNFRRDITSAVAVWCAVTLAVGPLLAGAISYLTALGSVTQKPDTPFSLSTAVVYLLAGMAPRFVTSIIEETARRLLSSNSTAASTSRTVPLTKIRGITPDVEARLDEEGIVDACGLAMANPNRLLRNTSFDGRQIVAWIDEALLIYNVPFWEALEADGITGAIDLAWYRDSNCEERGARDIRQVEAVEELKTSAQSSDQGQPADRQPVAAATARIDRVAVPVTEQPPTPVQASRPPPQANPQPAQTTDIAGQNDQRFRPDVIALAGRIKIEPGQLLDVIERVFEDAQVQQIWVMYQTDSHELYPADNGGGT